MLLDATPPLVDGWQNFYLIIGPSAAALIGLQFVVVALVKETPLPASPTGVGAFTTPTIVHFGAVLTLAAILSAPWTSIGTAALLIGIGSVLGAIYALVVMRRIRRSSTGYAPVLEDWLFHVVFPFVAYVVMTAGALGMPTHPRSALFWIAAMALSLLFIGIHNAWDTATYLSLSTRAGGVPDAAAPDAAAQNAAAPDAHAPDARGVSASGVTERRA
jgi:hypothetical protein